jgi:chromate reductase
MTQVSLLAIVGSLRSGSVNAATARAAVAAAPDDITVVVHEVHDLPLYNGDDEDAGPPAEMLALHTAVAASDGIIFFSPEYNGSFPAVTKNAIDWLSRPPTSWEGTPVTLVATTPGSRAGLGLREHFTTVMTRMPTRLFDTLGLGNYGERLTDGEITDAGTVGELSEFIAKFADFCRSDAD